MVQISDDKGRRLVDEQNQLPILQATKRDLCQSHPTGPACQRACPHDALVRISVGRYAELGGVAKASCSLTSLNYGIGLGHFAQRCISWAITIFAIAVSLSAVWVLTVRFGRSDLFTGYSLLGVCLLLAFLSVRKRMLALPIGPVKVWLQVHLYAGVLSLVLFVMHVGWFNGGWLELMLGSLFLWIAGPDCICGIYRVISPNGF
jgi:hypothetical protein